MHDRRLTKQVVVELRCLPIGVLMSSCTSRLTIMSRHSDALRAP
jgi:hypothetical protein